VDNLLRTWGGGGKFLYWFRSNFYTQTYSVGGIKEAGAPSPPLRLLEIVENPSQRPSGEAEIRPATSPDATSFSRLSDLLLIALKSLEVLDRSRFGSGWFSDQLCPAFDGH